jgi:protein TonB
METKKNPKLSMDRRRNSFFAMGFIVASGFTLVAFEWTTYQEPLAFTVVGVDVFDPTVLPPITIQQPKTIKRPKAAVDVSKPPVLVDNDVEIDTTVDIDEPMDTSNMAFNDLFMDEDSLDIGRGGGGGEPEIFVVVEYMPTWTGCPTTTSVKRGEFTERELLKYLAKNVRYPRACVDAGITGVVYIEYVVNSKGQVAGAKLLRGASPMLDKEALRVVNSFPDFNPGKQRGIPVNVKFTLPIRFTLN